LTVRSFACITYDALAQVSARARSKRCHVWRSDFGAGRARELTAGPSIGF